MTDYTKLVEALRHCSTTEGIVYCNVSCKYGWKERSKGCKDLLMTDAADAIEALQGKEAKAAKRNAELHAELEKWVSTAEGLQAEVDTLKHDIERYVGINAELTTEIEALQAESPKRGEWIRHPEVKNIYGGEYIECPFCGEKYVVQYIADEKFCRNCGADLRAKMEVQDG